MKLGFTLSLMLSDGASSLREVGASELDFSVPFNPTYAPKHDTHVAPLVLWVGQDARPTGMCAVSRFRFYVSRITHYSSFSGQNIFQTTFSITEDINI